MKWNTFLSQLLCQERKKYYAPWHFSCPRIAKWSSLHFILKRMKIGCIFWSDAFFLHAVQVYLAQMRSLSLGKCTFSLEKMWHHPIICGWLRHICGSLTSQGRRNWGKRLGWGDYTPHLILERIYKKSYPLQSLGKHRAERARWRSFFGNRSSL